ncbi:MAG: hypothetical protein RR346_02980 [Bacteroidales bacterium]
MRRNTPEDGKLSFELKELSKCFIYAPLPCLKISYAHVEKPSGDPLRRLRRVASTLPEESEQICAGDGVDPRSRWSGSPEPTQTPL